MRSISVLFLAHAQRHLGAARLDRLDSGALVVYLEALAQTDLLLGVSIDPKNGARTVSRGRGLTWQTVLSKSRSRIPNINPAKVAFSPSLPRKRR